MSIYLENSRKVFSRINLSCAILGAALLFGMATIVCFEVVARALGARSQLWVIEASEYAMLFITFLGAPYLLEKNRHVVLDLLIDSVAGSTRRVLQLFNAALGFFVCVTLAVVGFHVVVDQLQTGVREVTVMRPQSWWITAALPIGMALMAVQFLYALFGKTCEGEI